MAKRGRGRPPKSAQNDSMENREFPCQMCGKAYLSNPALYLHMKLKHTNVMQTISNNPGVCTGEKKARGRPRKIPSHFDHHMIGALGGGGGRTVDPTNENFLKSEDRAGGPTDPCFGFAELVA